MSSPTSTRRRGRPARAEASSPRVADAQTTPRASRRLRGEAAVPSSSPMFYQSSPAKDNSSSAETPDVRMDEPSSPIRASSTMDQEETTPRGNRTAIAGTTTTRTPTY